MRRQVTGCRLQVTGYGPATGCRLLAGYRLKATGPAGASRRPPAGSEYDEGPVGGAGPTVIARTREGDPGLEAVYRGVPALVLGGAGFIGAWVVRALRAHGAEVTVVTRGPNRTPAVPFGPGRGNVSVVAADLDEPAAPAHVVEAARPAIVFNLAGYGVDRSERDADRMQAVNASLVDRLCAAMAGRPGGSWTGTRLVHVGSALEYGRLEGRLVETAEVDPDTLYGRTKLQGTQAVASWSARAGLRALVARLFTVYGPGEHEGRLLPELMRVARTGTRLALTEGRQPRDFTYVEDVAEGLLRLGASQAPPGAVVNLATGRLSTVREFAETAAAVLGLDRALLRFGALPERDEEMWHGEVDVARLRELTSWQPPTSIADGIRRTREFSDAR